MAEAGSTSLTLLAQVQAMQPAAWHRLVELYAPLVQHWCHRKGLSTEDTADVFQEVFRAVADHVARFRRNREGDTFRGWLRTITTNKIHDHFRRKKGASDAEGGTDAQMRLASVPDPLGDFDDATEVDLLRQSVVRTLDAIRGDFEPRTWDAFWKSQIEQLPTVEIAEELQMTTAAVRKAKYRVLRRLREDMDGLLS